MKPLGLRAKTSAAFAAGALGVSATVTIGTYELTRNALMAERERTAVRAAYFDGAVVRQGLASEDADLVAVLRTLDTGQARRPLIYRDGRWFSRQADTSSAGAVPASLRELVADGRPGVQRVRLAGVPSLVVGVPLPGARAEYYELTSQTELRRTLRQVALSLVAVALLTTLSAAVLGRYVSRRILRPLTSVAGAARSIADGDLTARLQPSRDGDLAPLTESFNEMATELEGRLERDRRFAADVSHELRSPLQTLTAASGVLQNQRSRLDGRTAAAAGLVAAEVTRFSSLVTDLLELARSDAAAVREDVRPGELVARVCAQHGVPPERVHVQADVLWPLEARRYEQVVANLVQNADRHAGGATAVTCVVQGEVLHLVVEDAGPGIPPDERALVFDRFGRGSRASARGAGDGTGLGLALVAQHVVAHGGSVSLGEAARGGARFVVDLPRSGP